MGWSILQIHVTNVHGVINMVAGTGNEDGYREFANDNYSRVNAVYAGSMMVSCMLSVVDTMMPIVSLI